MRFNSKLIESAVEQMASLPGVGQRTALRYVMSMLKRKPNEVARFSESIVKLVSEIRQCEKCHNLCESAVCEICSNPSRDHGTICVVEDIRDFIAIENTNQYRGIYHVLGGIISPMDGIGPSDLSIDALLKRVETDKPTEIILALDASIEGETTNFFIFKKLRGFNVRVSNLSRGISFGDQLEYADEVTLGRSLINRVPYETPSV
ncbi:MAG: recombination mediator RecR [Flavobacteriales bacterium]